MAMATTKCNVYFQGHTREEVMSAVTYNGDEEPRPNLLLPKPKAITDFTTYLIDVCSFNELL